MIYCSVVPGSWDSNPLLSDRSKHQLKCRPFSLHLSDTERSDGNNTGWISGGKKLFLKYSGSSQGRVVCPPAGGFRLALFFLDSISRAGWSLSSSFLSGLDWSHLLRGRWVCCRSELAAKTPILTVAFSTLPAAMGKKEEEEVIRIAKKMDKMAQKKNGVRSRMNSQC